MNKQPKERDAPSIRSIGKGVKQVALEKKAALQLVAKKVVHQHVDLEVVEQFAKILAKYSGVSMEEHTAVPSIYLTGLSSKAIHTIYAGSFIVYMINVLADWLHTFYAVQGVTVTFALKDWAIYTMVGACFTGSVLNFLLFHLCCENALWQRWMIDEYGQGFTVLCQKMYHWLTDFDCFRISFLILVAQDTPMTLMNFWLISSCSIPQPNKPAWPFYLSCCTTIISLTWRGVMVFLAFRKIRFVHPTEELEGNIFDPELPHGEQWTDVYPRQEPTSWVIRNAAGLGNRGRRLSQYDECWPLRVSLWISHRKDHFSLPTDKPENLAKKVCRSIFCCFTCPTLCFVCTVTACVPCCHYYTCRKNANVSRQRFARTFTRYCSMGFHAVILTLSIFLLISLTVLNVLWLSSVHLAGNDHTAPELGLLCVTVDRLSSEVRVGLAPMTSSWREGVQAPGVEDHSNLTVDCKPLFDENGWGFWWQRRQSTPWILIKKFDDKQTLAIWTNAYISATGVQQGGKGSRPLIAYDMAYKMADHSCLQLGQKLSKWTMTKEPPWRHKPWPYGLACDCLYDAVWKDQRLCDAMF